MTLLELSQILGNVGEFFGAIAVVVTLVFLISQIRQNTEALRANSREFGTTVFHQLATSVFPYPEMGELLAKAHRAQPSDLTPAERERVGWFLMAALKSAETQYQNWLARSLDDDLYQAMERNLFGLVRSYPKYAPAFWDAAKGNYSTEFQKLLSPIIEQLRVENP